MKTLLLLLCLTFLSACASINSVSLTPIPKERQNRVQSQQSKLIILGFNFDNDFVDTLVSDLQNQCPQGKVTGLLTKDEDINYFLYIVWRKQVTATGYCVKGAQVSNATQKRGKASVDATQDTNTFDAEAGL